MISNLTIISGGRKTGKSTIAEGLKANYTAQGKSGMVVELEGGKPGQLQALRNLLRGSRGYVILVTGEDPTSAIAFAKELGVEDYYSVKAG